MKKKNLSQLMSILIITIISVSFVSCGDDGENDVVNLTPDVINSEANNSDLIGWWVTDKQPGYDGTFYWRLAIHFIDDQIVEFGEIDTQKGHGEYATKINGETYYYVDPSTENYTRTGNVIYIRNATMNIVNGTIRFAYYMGETEQYKKVK